MISWDAIVYDLANQSLDVTIDELIGRPYFESVLSQFRQALVVAHDERARTVVIPCSGGGLMVNQTRHPQNRTSKGSNQNRTTKENGKEQRPPPPKAPKHFWSSP